MSQDQEDEVLRPLETCSRGAGQKTTRRMGDKMSFVASAIREIEHGELMWAWAALNQPVWAGLLELSFE